jgi:hypothetical protein
MNCDDLKRSVLQWVGEEIECHTTDTGTLVATPPILRPNGDPIDVGIEEIGRHRWRISDMGDTYSGLFLAGVDLPESYVRGQEFRQLVEAHQIEDDGSELSVETSAEQLVERMFDFVHAIQSMHALQFTMKTEAPSRDFPSIVAKFLAEQHTSFEIPRSIDGKTGRWKFNFVLNHVREETLVKTLSATGKREALRRVEESVFEIQDVRELRPTTEAVVIADDEGDRDVLWGESVTRIFEGYRIPIYRFEGNRVPLIELARQYVRE